MDRLVNFGVFWPDIRTPCLVYEIDAVLLVYFFVTQYIMKAIHSHVQLTLRSNSQWSFDCIILELDTSQLAGWFISFCCSIVHVLCSHLKSEKLSEYWIWIKVLVTWIDTVFSINIVYNDPPAHGHRLKSSGQSSYPPGFRLSTQSQLVIISLLIHGAWSFCWQ